MRLPDTQKHLYTVSEYLRLEEAATEKHEYRNGEIVAMAGGSPTHSLISLNLGGEIRNALKGKPCRAYDSNLRVRVPKTGLYTYPDVTVICGEPKYVDTDVRPETVLNPRFVAEVLSPSTESYDRGKKFTQYREIETLQEVVLVNQDTPEVERFRRNPQGVWVIESNVVGMNAHLVLDSLGISVPLAEIYAGVRFGKPDVNANSPGEAL